jgi:hypothetical protein
MPSPNMKRGNQMFEALRKETDRSKACVGDAMLDEVFKELLQPGSSTTFKQCPS